MVRCARTFKSAWRGADDAEVQSSFGPPAPVLRPPSDRLDELVQPLSPGEAAVFDALTALEPGWTVFTKPRIGLDDPDFLAIHDRHGVCAIEVVDWRPETTRCTSAGRLEIQSPDGVWHPVDIEPRFRAARHRTSIFDQFYALPEHGGSPSSTIRSVVVLPAFTTVAAGDLFAQIGEDGRTSLVGIWGGEALGDSVGDIVRGLGCPPPPPESIEKLRRHVVASERSPLATGWDARMSGVLIEIAENPLSLRHRRVRGGAGSGKSTALAARAARLAGEGKRVLLLSFNVTIANRLRALVDAHARTIGANPTLVACANFHSFCTRVVQDAEVLGAHLSAPTGMPWTVGIVAKAAQAYDLGQGARFDAILIDEGQDFTTEWWELLRNRVLVDDGETLVAFDPTQDIYDRASWLEATVSVSPTGFTSPGELVRLDESLRLPNDLLELSAAFATDHLGGDAVSPSAVTVHDAGSVRNWVNVDRVPELGPAVGREVVRLLEECPTLSPGDVSFVCDYHHDGVAAVRVIEAAGIPVHHIFSRDPDAPRRRRKHRFWPDVAAVKGCTAHSLKGWQSPVVVLGIGADDRARRLAYVAMTRTALPDDGSPAFVSVVSADRGLDTFGETFVMGSADVPVPPAATPPPPPPPPPPAPPMAPPAPMAPPMPAPDIAATLAAPSPAQPIVAPSTLDGVTAIVPMPPIDGVPNTPTPAHRDVSSPPVVSPDASPAGAMASDGAGVGSSPPPPPQL